MVGVAGRSGVGSGGPRGGGRPKGSVNSESIKLQERALASGYAPLDVLLGMMRWYYEKAQKLLNPPAETEKTAAPTEAEIDRLFDKAGEHAARAAPFIHPRMSPMDLNSRFDMMRLTYDERRELARLLAKGLGLGEPDLGGDLKPKYCGHERAN
jgi:hypothetical protein